MRFLIMLISLTLILPSFAGIYTWKDASGRTVYGDNPPEQGKSKVEKLNPEPLTVIPGYKDPDAEEAKPVSSKAVSDLSESDKKEDNEEEDKPAYDSFTIGYPSSGDEIRSNDGSLTISLDLDPGLSRNDSIFVYVDGKKLVKDSKSLSISLTNLDRGEHSMFAVVRNDNGDVLLNSNTVKFHLLRSSVISNSRR